MIDFKIREDGVGHLMMNTPEYKVPPLWYILETEYPYLLESLREQNTFRIDEVEPTLFKEIVHDNKVVGFSSYDGGNGVFALKYIYVLPEYRGNNLLIKDLLDTKNTFEKHGFPYVAIDHPNWFVINSLIKHGYAKEINDHLIYSHVPLTFAIKKGKEMTDTEIEICKDLGLDTDEIKFLQANTNFYDKNICACICLELKMVSAMCDEDYKFNPNVFTNRLIDGEEYFSTIEQEIQTLVDEGVLAYED